MTHWHLDPRRLRRHITARFRAVRWIETLELGRRIRPASAPAPLLLDARSPEEHARAHLPGARWIDPEATDFAALGAERATPIVVYCSVGYRSAALCTRLQSAGYTDVRNLCGGIFQWANERRPLCAGEQRVCEVHPFSRIWRLWLRPDARAPLEPSA
jgi:rhodanese-related sulfurtransferase